MTEKANVVNRDVKKGSHTSVIFVDVFKKPFDADVLSCWMYGSFCSVFV